MNNDEKTREHPGKGPAEVEMHVPGDEGLLRSARIWENTFNNITDMITIHDRDYNIIHANKAAEKILGLPLLKDHPSKCFKFYHGEEMPPKGCPSCECLRTGKPVAFEIFEPHLNKYLEIRAMPQFNDRKELIGVIHIVRDITERKQMEEEITSLRKHLLTGELENESAFSSIVTRSRKMRAIFHYIEAVARSQKPVFITGETGVGKELIARTIHRVSGLEGEHVAVNIAGLDDTMFSDTLFGHRKGAFTGADRERSGLIVRASGGTLMLDEIADLNISSQVKLLRLLEEKIYYPLGSDVPEKSDARIIACSNHDIEKQISEGNFRKDLYYRLCAHHIHVPALRERLQDIPLLLDHFLDEASRSLNKRKPQLYPELITLLSNYQFPGNIRELQAMVYDAVAQHESGKLSMESFKEFMKKKAVLLPSGITQSDENAGSLNDIFGRFPTLKEVEEYVINEAMRSANGNQTGAASLLGITRQALNQRLKKKSNPS